jgi:pilus assembly protein Flp/PilA
MSWLWNFLKEEDGPTAVEYAVMLALILITCFAAIGSIGQETVELMDPQGRLSGTLHSGS